MYISLWIILTFFNRCWPANNYFLAVTWIHKGKSELFSRKIDNFVVPLKCPNPQNIPLILMKLCGYIYCWTHVNVPLNLSLYSPLNHARLIKSHRKISVARRTFWTWIVALVVEIHKNKLEKFYRINNKTSCS